MAVSEQFTARISTELSESGDALTIRVTGNFDFNIHRDFLRAYQDLSPAPRRYCIDLSETQHMDSAALGMLLLLRDHCMRECTYAGECCIELRNANTDVCRLLAVSNFDKLFTICPGL
ncbi:STAS domain-containing protein [Microbulbifer thermotolerans]|uniref:STAS domain-containing protein n=1 Tax=Microbulbifer thermotolerans TaxID=252514 RepID=A0A143HM72_MICTH|nr:STAS domain-containing protein [Microbulbifer thermotolerans]AMX02783.1 hypothetical protein A3224_09485 [Microbulbifer thermotolerans]MCX2779645.1 STAS domain-containing protein [Microbulbifer thermotolerans]MCX2782611.1 STAS domain-containing protein [Microbulbifer thermotolerans]MCX2794623.1 STAS domain-containing protein [Microbulbifer thermotolerans]MCX2801451.1 STAS domain-containing protein [Microbulbifer thermotolerans]